MGSGLLQHWINITLNPANKKTDQSLFDFQTGIGIAAHAILNTEQLISHTRTALVDTTVSLHDSDRGFMPVSEMHELLNNYLMRFITFWTVLWLNGLVIQLIF